MHLYYEGTDITDDVDVCACIHNDASGGKCDMLDIEFENADRWMRWKPQQDDMIEATECGYTTGTLYINTFIPSGDRFRVLATSLKSVARRKVWQSFKDAKLKDIIASCAAQCDMGWFAKGIDENAAIPYIERENEGCAAFLDRLMRMEGATLKTVMGRLACIGIEYAQDIEAIHNVTIETNKRGVSVQKRENLKYSGITVKTPYAEASAIDNDAAQQETHTITDVPALSNIQAARWARGLLLNNNRAAEHITIQSEFDAGMTAMARIDLTGEDDITGAWIVDETVYDLKHKRATARLYRCLHSIS